MTKLLVSVLIAAVCLPVGVVAASEPESLRQAAEEGATEDQYRYAAALEAAGQYKRAVRWYERAAGDSPEAALALAECLLDGRGTRADPVKAVALLKDASGAGLVRAQYLLGLQYQEGNGVGHDVEAAARWLGAAADSGHAGAQMRAGLMALNGVGMRRDAGIGLAWLRDAAHAGDETAQLNLGLFHLSGRAGVKQDDAAAARWFHKAAEHRNATALFNLGALYAGGTGVDQDLVEAHKWFELARLAGDQTAGQARDQVGGALTPAGLRRSAQLVDAWLGERR